MFQRGISPCRRAKIGDIYNAETWFNPFQQRLRFERLISRMQFGLIYRCDLGLYSSV